jgi:hypothetical protein
MRPSKLFFVQQAQSVQAPQIQKQKITEYSALGRDGFNIIRQKKENIY